MNSLISWFATNHKAANLLMLILIFGGVLSAFTINTEVLPKTEDNFIDINTQFPGANPKEVEELVTIRIEESIKLVDGIKRIFSQSSQEFSEVTLEIEENYDISQVLNDVNARVGTINNFPKDAYKPVASRRINRTPLTFFALHGNVDDDTLKKYGNQIRDELMLLKGVSLVSVTGIKNDEISIEISERNLKKYGLTFDELAEKIRGSSINTTAGLIKAEEGEFRVNSYQQAYNTKEFSNIAIAAKNDDSNLLLGDIATVIDGFENKNLDVRFNGTKTLAFNVYISDDPKVISATQEVRQYLENVQNFLPKSLNIEITFETKVLFEERLGTLLENALSGLLLIFIVLMLFLRPFLAAWVCAGIFVSFAGALWIMPYVGMSLNMTTMFAFLMVLGIVVDDAIVVGENIHSYIENDHDLPTISGTQAVAKPVIIAVLSTIIFFVPMFDFPSELGALTYPIAVVVILCLFFSLIESLFILPSHLHGMEKEKQPFHKIPKEFYLFRGKITKALNSFIGNLYIPALTLLIKRPSIVISSFAVLLVITIVLYKELPKSFYPNIPNDYISVQITMPDGIAFGEAKKMATKLANAAEALRSDPLLLDINGNGNFMKQVTSTVDENAIGIFIGLVGSQERILTTEQIGERLRDIIGPVPEAKEYSLGFTFRGEIPDLQFNVHILSDDPDTQKAAVTDTIKLLSGYNGINNVRNSLDLGRYDIHFSLKPGAESLGLTAADVSNYIKQSIYGEEVQRVPREKEDVRVMLRYPEANRQSLADLQSIRIQTSNNIEIPLEEIVDIEFIPSHTTINRIDRKRSIIITAGMENGYNKEAITEDFLRKSNDLKKVYPGYSINVDGDIKSQQDSNARLIKNIAIAIFVSYILLAVTFKDYLQPVLILIAIPISLIGAVWGHILLGHEISVMSQLGFLACAGVVTNDCIVLLDRINNLRAAGKEQISAVLEACQNRFRSILLTSLTTFIGLLPILFEDSVQARYLIPMSISLAFGVAIAMPVTLMLIPCLYIFIEKLKTKIKDKFSSSISKEEILNN